VFIRTLLTCDAEEAWLDCGRQSLAFPTLSAPFGVFDAFGRSVAGFEGVSRVPVAADDRYVCGSRSDRSGPGRCVEPLLRTADDRRARRTLFV